MTSKCPTCKKDNSARYKPFCSKRCADVDLGKWFNESYLVETDEIPVNESNLEE
jgi:endogenous inhibitor of DNA gyrase (YacG/DUF329 family)